MIGVDIPIERLRLSFESNLWNGKNNKFFGRCFRNERNDDLIPEVIVSGNEYQEVLLQDFNDSTVFFDVEPERESTSNTRVDAKIGIYFAVDLSALYPSLSRNDATETAYNDVINLINLAGFDVKSIISGFESYATWGYDEASRDSMSSYHLFKINTLVNYNLNC